MCVVNPRDVHCVRMRRTAAIPAALTLAAAALAATPAAAQRTPEPQAHEVRLDVDISVERQANGALIDGQYTFTPSKLNRVDEVVPILRRFVRHPSAVWVRIMRHGYSREPVTGASAGGILQLGPAYITGNAGIEYDIVDYDPGEHAYWALPFSGEVGFRPLEGLSIGAFYWARPVIGNSLDEFLVMQAERDGTDQKIGGRVAYATPTDRVYASLAGWGRIADWSFEGTNPGDLTIRGFGAEARLWLQVTSSFTFGLRLEAARDHWDNQRAGEEDRIGVETERDVGSVRGGAEVVYWHKGRFGFRFGLGGGYDAAPPTVNNRETGVLQIGLGVITRF
jgi:hypothetical protein